MATQTTSPDVTLEADVDLSASQYCGVYLNSDREVILPTGAGGPIFGVLQNKPAAAGRASVVRTYGISKMKLGGTVASDDPVRVDSAGRAVVANAADIAAGAAIGVCVEGGAINNIGSVRLGPLGAGTTLQSGIETVTSGALSLYTDVSFVSVTGTQAYTLADGLYLGQKKRVECTVAATTPLGTLTINDAATGEPTSWVFGHVQQAIDLVWTSTGWKLLAINSAGQDIPAASSTINLLFASHDIVITGTMDWVLPDGEVQGQVQTFNVSAAGTTPVGTISGLFYDNADFSTDGTDISINAAGDQAVVQWVGSRWLTLTLVSATT